MKCPNDGATLTMSERSGVEIDYCPECRGVWLDRGELDKILDRASAELSPREPDQRGYRQEQGYQNAPAQGYQQSYQGHRRPKRKEHWLSELFD